MSKTKINNELNLVRSVNKNVRSSTRKLKPILKALVGKKVNFALRDLEFSNKRICGDVKKTLASAIANAENNYALDILIFIAPTKDDQIYWLSYGRYAPVQIIYGAGGGTTGLCNSIDYFFVSDKMANQDIYESYSEQIIRK